MTKFNQPDIYLNHPECSHQGMTSQCQQVGWWSRLLGLTGSSRVSSVALLKDFHKIPQNRTRTVPIPYLVLKHKINLSEIQHSYGT